METYRTLGIIGGILVLILSFAFPLMAPTFFAGGLGNMMGGFYGGMMGGSGPYYGASQSSVFPFFFMVGFTILGIIAGALGIVGSVISNRLVAGILLIIGAILSLPVFMGGFGIGFLFMLVAGILALVNASGGGSADKRVAGEKKTTTLAHERSS